MPITTPNYTQTPNEIFDKYMPIMKGSELKVILFIIRKTLGFVDINKHRKITDKISISQIVKGTGMQTAAITKALNNLESKYKLISSRKEPGRTTVYSLLFEKTLSESEIVEEAKPFRKVKGSFSESEKVGAKTLSESENTKESNIKKKYKKRVISSSLQNNKKTYLEFVKLSDDEYGKLNSKYDKSDIDSYIETLNNYMGSKGKQYKSHYYTILNWMRKENIPKLKYCPTCKNKLGYNNKCTNCGINISNEKVLYGEDI